MSAESPFAELIGYDCTEWREGYAKVTLPVSDDLTNRHGTPHGGVYGVLLDTALGLSGCWVADGDAPVFGMTLSLNVQFLSRPKGGLFITEGFKTGGGKSTYFAEGHVKDETGELIAKGTGVFRYRRSK